MEEVTRMTPATRLKENFLFFRSALRQYNEIGMFFPSSTTVAERLAALVPLKTMQLVVEVGSGTGRISRVVRKAMAHQAQLVCIEKNEDFCKYLRESLPESNVTILNMPAEDLIDRLDAPIKPKSADCVILSLAPVLGSSKMRAQWVRVCESLVRKDGLVVIQQFIPVIGRHFGSKKWRTVHKDWYMDFPPFRVDVLQKRSEN
jgi:phospholipid N-methyltransferase